MENKELTCKDCKYMQKSNIPRARTGSCLNEKCDRVNKYTIGYKTKACSNFKKK